jgi:predicted NAD/FAD-binding protein
VTRRRVAIVGGGIAGCGAAWSLADSHDVTLFEAGDKLGGHADSVEVATANGPVHVDVGVMGIRRGHTSANLSALMELLGVEAHDDVLTMGADLGAGKTWTNDDEPIGHRTRFVAEIERFKGLLTGVAERPIEEMAAISVRDFLRATRFAPDFVDQFVDPLMRLVFFNPDPLGIALAVLVLAYDEGFISFDDRPTYRRIAGGTGRLFEAIATKLGARVRTRSEVVSIERAPGGPVLRFANGEEAAFDDVILAVAADVALRLLASPSEEERTVLEGLQPELLEVVLHDDRRVWGTNHPGPAPVLQVVESPGVRRMAHFDVGRWHGLALERAAIMSRGPAEVPPERIYARRRWMISPLTPYALYCRSLLPSIQGARGTWFCGQGYTIPAHDECFVSGLIVAEKLGVPLPFRDRHGAAVLQGFVKRILGEREAG